MKIFNILIILVITIFLNLSCRNNRLKTNEKELAKEIILEEMENKEADRVAREMESSETRNSRSGSFRKKEIRSVDPRQPPIHLNILDTINSSREFKLSDVASSIWYVKLQTPPDTMLLYEPFLNYNSLTSSIQSEGETIIIQGVFGLTRFNMQGEYQETIWKNETGINLSAGLVVFGGKDFFGAEPSVPAALLNGNLYFSFQNGPAGNSQVMKYKAGTNKNMIVQSQIEIQDQGKIKGDTIFNTKQSAEDRFSWIYGIGTDTWAGVNNKWNAGRSGALLVTYNNNGDTLCQFTDYDRILNFSFSKWRQPVELESYSFNGLLTIKQEYNDTVFRLIPPNQLLPVFIIDFGELKVSYKNGLNPEVDLSKKCMLYSLYETNDFLFISYTQNHDGMNNRKKNAVKFYNVIFNKMEGKLYQQSGFTLAPEGIINDLDGGKPLWPEFITPQGEMMMLVSGKMMKDYVNSAGFKEAVLSDKKRQKQIEMASGLRVTDMIIMIVK